MLRLKTLHPQKSPEKVLPSLIALAMVKRINCFITVINAIRLSANRVHWLAISTNTQVIYNFVAFLL